MYIIQGLRRIFYLICQVFFEKKSKKMSRHFHYNICSKDSYFLILMTLMPTAGWGLSLSAYEMAQIGLMVLNNGVYNNTRIVSEAWIEMMTKSYISTDEKFGNQDYGFLWWLPHRTRDVIAAIGDGGNIIYVDRKNQIVVAITAHFKPMVFDRVEYIEKNIVEVLTES